MMATSRYGTDVGHGTMVCGDPKTWFPMRVTYSSTLGPGLAVHFFTYDLCTFRTRSLIVSVDSWQKGNLVIKDVKGRQGIANKRKILKDEYYFNQKFQKYS